MRLISESDYIAHHGIKGQKWGVRRFRNADGTLTEAGKKHYFKKIDSAEKRQRNSYDRISPSNKKRGEKYQALHKNVIEVKDKIQDTIHNSPGHKELRDFYGQEDEYWMSYKYPGTDYYKDDPEYNRIRNGIEKASAKAQKEYGEAYLSFKNDLVEAKLKDLSLPSDPNMVQLYKELYHNKRPWDTLYSWLE